MVRSAVGIVRINGNIYKCECKAGYFLPTAYTIDRCSACPKGTLSSQGSTILAQCTVAPNFYGKAGKEAIACPAHTSGPAESTGLENCVCNAGYYGSDGACQACPDHSHSAAASLTVADCKCDPVLREFSRFRESGHTAHSCTSSEAKV